VHEQGYRYEEIARGRYFVEEVAKRPECHTLRKENEKLHQNGWLRGAPIWIRPVGHWGDRAPAVAGLPSFADARAERVLDDGSMAEGQTAKHCVRPCTSII
jgi:hypothetical protein